MPFHIRLVKPTQPKISQAQAVLAPKMSMLIEFCQGIAFGLGVALVMLCAFWLVRTNGLGI